MIGRRCPGDLQASSNIVALIAESSGLVSLWLRWIAGYDSIPPIGQDTSET